MGRRAKLKQERKKKYYLDKIKNSPIGKLADYQLLSLALDLPELRKIFDLMDNFHQDLCLPDEASFYFLFLLWVWQPAATARHRRRNAGLRPALSQRRPVRHVYSGRPTTR